MCISSETPAVPVLHVVRKSRFNDYIYVKFSEGVLMQTDPDIQTVR